MSTHAQVIDLEHYNTAQNTRMLEAAQIVEDLAYDRAGNMRPDQTGQLIDFARELMVLSKELHQL